MTRFTPYLTHPTISEERHRQGVPPAACYWLELEDPYEMLRVIISEDPLPVMGPRWHLSVSIAPNKAFYGDSIRQPTNDHIKRVLGHFLPLLAPTRDGNLRLVEDPDGQGNNPLVRHFWEQ